MEELDDENYIPGTEHIFADEDRLAQSYHGTELKRDGSIILIPQPSDSPNDPLNWKPWRKWLQFVILMFITAFTAAISNDAGACQDQMNEQLGISWDSMNTASGVLFIGIGYLALLLSPAAFLYGRRIGYVICMISGIIGAIWFARTMTTSDSIGNQFFVGVSEACAEAQVQLSLADLYFQHQLGSVLGYYIMATSTGTYLGPLIAGYVDERIGWRWVSWLAVIIGGGGLLVILFCLEETYFDRTLAAGRITEGVTTTDSHTISRESKINPKEKMTGIVKQDNVSSLIEDDDPQLPLDFKRRSYWKSIALITPGTNLVGTGFKQYLQRLWLTLRVFTFPPVLYSGLQWGAQDAWLTFYMTTEDDTWSSTPHNYGADAIAIMNVPTLIGALIGCYYGGTVSDWFVMFMAKRNNGVKEPEHRLWLMFLTAVISPLGLFLFGIGTADNWSWPPVYIGLAFVGFGFGCAGDLSMAYLMDCYPGMVLEGMVGVSVINNTLACIFTFVCSPWIETQGVKMAYVTIGILSFIFLMTTAPMIYYGKKCRRFTKPMYVSFLAARDGTPDVA